MTLLRPFVVLGTRFLLQGLSLFTGLFTFEVSGQLSLIIIISDNWPLTSNVNSTHHCDWM